MKADGEDKTGRKHDGIHNGVDYMFTLIDGDPQHASTRLDVFEADGKTRRGTCNIVIHGESLYLAAEMALRQQDGHSVFEYSVSSYVKNNGPSVGLGYCRAVSAGAPKASDTRLLANPDMVVINGTVPGWQIVGGSRPVEAQLAADGKDGGLVLESLFWPEGLAQTVSLTPGHYLFARWRKRTSFKSIWSPRACVCRSPSPTSSSGWNFPSAFRGRATIPPARRKSDSGIWRGRRRETPRGCRPGSLSNVWS